MTAYFALFWIILILVCGAAARWGGRPERTAGALYLVAAAATVLVRPALVHRYAHVETAVLTIDLALMLGLLIVTIRTDRWWPICATAFQTLTVLSHIGKVLNPSLWRYGYQLMAVWSAVPSLLPLLIGIITAAQHQSKKRMSDATFNG